MKILGWLNRAVESYWMTAIALAYLTMFLMPATWLWYEHTSILIGNTVIGQSAPVVIRRKIKQDFEGIRTIQVLPIPPTDGEPHCAAERTQRYKVGEFET